VSAWPLDAAEAAPSGLRSYRCESSTTGAGAFIPVVNLEFPGRQWTRSPVVLAQALIATSKSALKAVTMIFMMFS
jgi:hypothetical protein